MKKTISILLSIVIILCVFTSAIPSFALTYNNFTYEIVDENVVITKYTGSESTVLVPSQIDGLNVQKIGENAFKDNKTITSVTVSSGVKDIGARAFENCIFLATISLPDTITHIGEKAIYNTAYYNNKSNWKPKTTSNNSSSGGVNMGTGSGNTSIDWEDIVAHNLDYLYLGKNLIEATYSGSYAIKYGTRVIADGAFAGCDASSVTLSNQLVTIGKNAFKDCQNLKTINFCDKLENIGDSAFENCVSLEKINLPQKDITMNATVFYNTGYYNNHNNWRGNALYYNDKVIGVNENCNTVEIKDGATEIISGALLDKTAIIPTSVTKISDTAFTDNSSATILGYSNSYAKEYATANQIKFIAIDSFEKCDLNFDGIIDSKDYEIICKISSTQNAQTDLITYLGDLDNDGAVDGFDAIILDLINKGMPPTLEKGDVNGDGRIDLIDYDLLVSIVTIQGKVTDNIMFNRCDINEDGAIDAFDVIYLDLYLNNLMPII